jgi:hypothetical protein
MSIGPFEPIEQAIEGGFPFLLGFVGPGRDFFADAVDEVQADRFAFLLCGWAFGAGLVRGWRSIDLEIRFGGHASPPSWTAPDGADQLIGAMIVHQFSPLRSLFAWKTCHKRRRYIIRSAVNENQPMSSRNVHATGRLLDDLLPRGVQSKTPLPSHRRFIVWANGNVEVIDRWNFGVTGGGDSKCERNGSVMLRVPIRPGPSAERGEPPLAWRSGSEMYHPQSRIAARRLTIRRTLPDCPSRGSHVSSSISVRIR